MRVRMPKRVSRAFGMPAAPLLATSLIPAEVVAPQNRQAGVRAGEHIHLDFGEGFGAPGLFFPIIQRGDIEAPARQRIGIAVQDADADVSQAKARHHRQLAQLAEQIGMPRRSALEHGVNLVRAFDHALIDRLRIGAAATGCIRVLTQFSLDVAQDGVVPQHAFVHFAKTGVIDVEPVDVAVEAQGHRAGFGASHRLDCSQALEIAVQSADHVQGFGAALGRAGDGPRSVAIAQRADAESACWRA